jgi:UDP-3-O-[3-hydroxymyristoyl] glucosamine N-acyltransferase
MKIKEFAEIVSGEIIGDPEKEITGVSGIRQAKAGDITFVSSGKYIKYLAGSKASCAIVKDVIPDLTMPQIRVANPHYAFARALECLYPKPIHAAGISSQAFVASSSSIGKDVSIYPLAYVSENAVIGEGSVLMPGTFVGNGTTIGRQCLLYPNVTVREGVTLGDRVILHSGTVIGSDGFGYVFEGGEHYKIPQVGGVIIEDDVEIGSNVSVDRATTGNTIIRKGTKIDNLVQIAHNVVIGQKSLIVAQVGIAGSTEIGDFVIMGGQSAAADHSTIESGTMLAAQSGIKGNVAKGVYAGSPAIPHAIWLRAQALFAKLPEMNKKIRDLEEKISRLEKGEK